MLSLKLPKKVTLDWGTDFIKVEGPLGIIIKRRGEFNIAVKESLVYLWSNTNPEHESTYLAYIRAMVVGVWKGFTQKLKLVGVGFKASINQNILQLKLGFSHEVNYKIPDDISILVSKNKGTILIIKGKENYRVQQIAREIRLLRIPDAYKGKGVQYKKEVLVLKKGKRESK
jgi:large subunit ribosomal protein L6